MLLANQFVGKIIVENSPDVALLRKHDSPNPMKISNLQNLLKFIIN